MNTLAISSHEIPCQYCNIYFKMYDLLTTAAKRDEIWKEAQFSPFLMLPLDRKYV